MLQDMCVLQETLKEMDAFHDDKNLTWHHMISHDNDISKDIVEQFEASNMPWFWVIPCPII